MSTRKKIHTTAFERLSNRNNKKLSQTRRELAAEAARIMATQAQNSFRIAKQKAADRLGISSRAVLPSNVEIEAALRAYQGFYGGKQHSNHIQKLRKIALRVMRSLELFCPRLVGPVLAGTADRYARVSLHLFNDPPDAVAVHLMEHGLSFHAAERKILWHDRSYRQVPLLVTDAEGTIVELTLFSHVDLRQAPLSPVDGRPQKRAPLSEVECLLAGT